MSSEEGTEYDERLNEVSWINKVNLNVIYRYPPGDKVINNLFKIS